MSEFVTLGSKSLLHNPRRLNLLVVLTAVRNHGRVKQVADVARDIVLPPQHALVPRHIVRTEPLIPGSFSESRARADRSKPRGMMCPDMPRSRASHRKADE